MAQTTDDIILNIEVKYEDAINGIVEYNKNITKLKNKQDELKESLKNGSMSL